MSPPKQNGSHTNTPTISTTTIDDGKKIGRMHSKLSMTLRIMILQKYSCLTHWWVSFAYWRRAREKKTIIGTVVKKNDDCWHASYNIKHYTVHDFRTPKGVAVKKKLWKYGAFTFFHNVQQQTNIHTKNYQRENIWKFYGLRFLRSHDCCCSTQNGV